MFALTVDVSNLCFHCQAVVSICVLSTVWVSRAAQGVEAVTVHTPARLGDSPLASGVSPFGFRLLTSLLMCCGNLFLQIYCSSDHLI